GFWRAPVWGAGVDFRARPRLAGDRLPVPVGGPPAGAGGGEAFRAVAVDQAVEPQRVGVAAVDRDPAAALARAVAEDAQALEMNGLVLVVAAQHRDGLAPGARDGESAQRDEPRLLELHRVAVRALRDRALQDHAPDRRRGVGLEDDAIRFAGASAVLARDRHLLAIGAGLQGDGVGGERGVDRRLDRHVARRLAAAGGISRVRVARDALRRRGGG